MMHEIEADMHLSDEKDVLAFGMVTVDQCIKFPVQMRKYQDKESGEEKAFLSFPRREGKNGWEDVIHPDKKLREEITNAVGEAIKKELQKDLNLPELEAVEVTPITLKGYANAKAQICGLATIQVCGLTVKGITVKQGENGLFVNMPQYKNKGGEYKDIAYGTSRAMQEKIKEAVLDTYKDVVKQKEAIKAKVEKGAVYGKTI